MDSKVWFVVSKNSQWQQVQVISKCFESLEAAKNWCGMLAREHETEYWICETVYG